MQLTTLLTLLPLLTAINAVPACNRPGGADASSSRRRKHHQTRSRAPQVVPVTGAPVSSAVSTAPLAGPGPTSEPSEASVIPLPSVMDDTPASSAAASASASTTVSVAPVVPSPVGGGNNAPASSAPASSAVATTSRAAAAPASSAVVTTSRPAPAPVSSAAPAPAPAPVSSAVSAPPTSNGVSAIGMAMNYESKANIASFGGDIGWYYSWNLDTLPNTAGLEFVPMIWGADAAQRFDGNLREGSTHVLGFNEPDIGNQYGGSNMAAATAATLHKQWTSKVPAGIKIGSPAVARGGKKWMTDWLAACGGGCKYDFVPYHFYGTDANQLIEYTKDFYNTYKKPLWLTEVACHDYGTGTVCNAQQVRTFMNTFFTWARSAEGQSMLERWSWFGAFPNHAATNANGILNADGTANDIGKYYASF